MAKRVRIVKVHPSDGMYATDDQCVEGAVGTFESRPSTGPLGLSGWLGGNFRVESYPPGCYFVGTEQDVPVIIFNYVKVEKL